MKAVLFDMDGVLVESYQAWFHLLADACRDLGYQPISREMFASTWGQGVQADRDTFFTRHKAHEVERYYEERFVDHIHHVEVEPDGPKVFAALRQNELALAVITNTPAALARPVLARAGVEPDVLVGGTDIPNAKPAPDIGLRACELLGIEPAEALVVGDSRFDREAAAAAGARFIGLRIEGGEHTISSLGELIELVC